MPMPLDTMGAASPGLDEFRVSAPREVAAMLRQLARADVPLDLRAADGCHVGVTLWAVDAERGTLGFSVDRDDPALNTLLSHDELVVVGYLDSVKLQFDIAHPVLVHGVRSSVLNCSHPHVLYRFQRRGAYRVRPPDRNAPSARLRHTDIAEMRLSLRVLDISIGGCALHLPDDVPPMQVGGVLNQVDLELDADTRFHVNLRLQHVTSLGDDSRGLRLGCEFVRADPLALRTLQRFIDQAQTRSKLMTID